MDDAKSRLKIGVDVPWVTSWTTERILGVRPCRFVDGRLALHQLERPGYGRPDYSKNHLNRQRASIVGMLCPMCGKPTDEGDRWTQTAKPTSAGELRRRGMAYMLPPVSEMSDQVIVVDAGAIAPSHLVCAELAQCHCPHLGAMTNQTLSAFPPRWTVAPLWIEAKQPAPSSAPSVPVVSFVQLCGVTDELIAAS